jgi:molecular chaperone GrpE
MVEAVRAVEAREKSVESQDASPDDPQDPGEDPDQPESPKKSAASAVTESLIDAKHELEQVLKQTQEEAKSLRDKWLRAAADLENYKKRAIREREEVVKFGNERLLRDFLPIIDDLDRFLSSATADDAKSQGLMEGLKLIQKKFLDQLEKHSVTSFSAVGQPFDPNNHEAVQQVHSDAQPMGTVVNQLQRGFHLAGRLLRPALVTVSLGPAGSATGDSAGQKEQG